MAIEIPRLDPASFEDSGRKGDETREPRREKMGKGKGND